MTLDPRPETARLRHRPPVPTDESTRRAVIIVAALNGLGFVVESAVALAIRSLALMADAIDFLEDTGLNLLALWAMGRNPRTRAAVAMALAVILFLPAIWIVWNAFARLGNPIVPDPLWMTVTGLGAFVINLASALVLLRHRSRGATMQAVWLSARNDAAANLAIVGAGFAVYATRSGWPDVVVGLAILAMNLLGAVAVMQDALAEWRAAGEHERGGPASDGTVDRGGGI